MNRKELENSSLTDLLKISNDRYGLYESNSLVAREMTRIYNKIFPRNVVVQVKKEAVLRVLTGQHERRNPFDTIFQELHDNQNNDINYEKED